MTSGWSKRARASSRILTPLDAWTWRAASMARLERLADSLAHPALFLTPADLAALFEVDITTVTAVRPQGLADYPDLPVRIRGAFGRVLRSFGPPIVGRRDPAARPRAYDVIFEEIQVGHANAKVAKPLVIRSDVIDRNLVISVGLVGAAGFWRPDAAAALVGALEGGIAYWENGRQKVPVTCIGARHERVAGFAPPTYGVREARLIFRTPLRLRAGDALVLSGPSFLIALANRVARLAQWMSARLDINWDEVHNQARRVEVDVDGLMPYRWSRGTQRARTRLAMIGHLGPLVLRGDLRFWVPFLQIGAAVNAGSHASLGLGRYDLSLLP